MNALRLAALCLVVAASGCAAPTLIRFNDQEIEYENLWSARFPQGAQVMILEQKRTLRVEGTEPIRVNGDEVWADEDGIRIGTRELRVAANDRVVVDRTGQIHVVSVSVARRVAKPAPTTVEASAERPSAEGERADSRSRTEGPEAGSQEDTSPWGFLR